MAWQKRKGIMLCQPLDEANLKRNWQYLLEEQRRLGEGVARPYLYVQPKLDGVRCRVWWPEGGENEKVSLPILYSSQGNPILGVPHINIILQNWAENVPEAKRQWDGELYSPNLLFEDIVSITSREVALSESHYSIEFHIFDFIPEFEQHMETFYFHKRLAVLKNLLPTSEADAYLKMVPTFEVHQTSEDPLAEGELTEKLDQFVRDSYEGIIIRNPYNTYAFKRPFTILKWKPAKKDWYRILDFLEAKDAEGKGKQELGAILCEDRYGYRFKVGTGAGITAKMKKRLWKERLEIQESKNAWAEVTYQNLTAFGVPRFGKAITIRITNFCGEPWE